MRFLPPAWEGIHPAFPASTDPHPKSPLNPLSAEELPLGLAVAGITRLLFRKRWRPGFAMATVGFIASTAAALELVNVSQMKSDVKALLDKEHIKMPPQKWFTLTEKATMDDFAVGGGLLGSTLGTLRAMPQLRPGLGLMRNVGLSYVGYVLGQTMFILLQKRELTEARRERRTREQIAGAEIYRSIMGSDPLRKLYPLAAMYSNGKGFVPYNHESENLQNMTDGWLRSIAGRTGAPDPSPEELAAPVIDEGYETKRFHTQQLGQGIMPTPGAPRIEEQARGTFAFLGLKLPDGNITYMSQRDYHWRPASPAIAIEALEGFLREMQEERSTYVQITEFTWRLTLKWEARCEAIRKRSQTMDQTPKAVQCIKINELLNSTHQDLYQQIAKTDWIIAETQKLILQYQHEDKGGWRPSSAPSSYDPKTYEPEFLLKLVHGHRRKLEELSRLPTTASIPENLKMIRENLDATLVLEEELERKVEELESVENDDDY